MCFHSSSEKNILKYLGLLSKILSGPTEGNYLIFQTLNYDPISGKTVLFNQKDLRTQVTSPTRKLGRKKILLQNHLAIKKKNRAYNKALFIGYL